MTVALLSRLSTGWRLWATRSQERSDGNEPGRCLRALERGDADTAALLCALDLAITVTTSVVHFVGALDVETRAKREHGAAA